MPQQITIFGGSGFIGRALIRRLAKTGAIIRVATRDVEKTLPLKPMGNVGQIVPIPCSVRSDTDVAEAIGQSDIVINLLGILFEKGRNNFKALHVEAAARIARTAKERGVKHLIHMSALGADDHAASKYAQSKAAGEQAIKTFYPKATIIRPSIVFGAEDNFFNKFAGLAQLSPALPLIGGGLTKFQPVYVDDVAHAICKVLEKTETAGQLFELGGPQVYSFRQLLEYILEVTHRQRSLINMPWALASFKAIFLQLAPQPMLTCDQVLMLKSDNVVKGGKTFRDLDMQATALELIVPTYLARFRPVNAKQEAHPIQ
ncbi:MAG: complex I NDUFA9 subunit family protein [Alphaproteobacteria bacterium]